MVEEESDVNTEQMFQQVGILETKVDNKPLTMMTQNSCTSTNGEKKHVKDGQLHKECSANDIGDCLMGDLDTTSDE